MDNRRRLIEQEADRERYLGYDLSPELERWWAEQERRRQFRYWLSALTAVLATLLIWWGWA